MDTATRACVNFLLGQQASDGSWRDWDLPPGRSGPWTTAYVGWQLVLAFPEAGSATQAAVRWLVDQQDDRGGWGYNSLVGSDADSTAHAMLFMCAAGLTPDDQNYERLLGFQQPDGGFATYEADEGLGSWGSSHPDVSAVAARTLLSLRPHAATELERVIDYVARQLEVTGLWNSFWWCSPLYATQACLALAAATDVPVDLGRTHRVLSSLTPGNAFECALLLDCLNDLGDVPGRRADELIQKLSAYQLADGSWPSTPILRIPDRDCTAPWERLTAAPVYTDPGRLFTSATVLRALSRAAQASGSSARGRFSSRCIVA